MQPILSVVVPTKNRYEYLEVLIKALLKENSQDFELIIQDNSENNTAFRPYINAIKDPRFVYNYYPDWLSVCDNCDMGILQAKGKYICMIGDDDGVLVEKCIEFCKWMDENAIDAAKVNPASYVWPDVTHSVWGNTLSGKLEIANYSSKCSIIQLENELDDILKKGGGFGLGILPCLYQGIVSKKILEELRAMTGTCFPGPSPDMSNAIGLIPFIRKAIQIDFPLVVSGHGAKSTGGQGQRKEHHGDIEQQSFLPKDTVKNWDRRIPFFWSGHTIWSESARRALMATGQETKVKSKFSFAYLYASCFVYEKYHSKVFDAIKANRNFIQYCIVWIQIIIYFPIIIFNRGINYLKNLIKYKSESQLESQQHDDISSAISELNSYKLILDK